ncbi:helix-turn-helix domain-containing protein [Nocardioides sp. WV_118_6]|uniref:IclR family transcriptional regulator n=1 Tax=Nocardioides simplex TaxID=2045 RepID=UPI0021500138|nr:helix-turn-helix domain-containing protein [Pimelobacter simplex]UUW91119.1 helix-turn-helix domain-containing protein [Pimelobacter simplex]UUW94947.1 helix-turn-helix domain-containing protein [Pimelobacter simplex]
MTVTALPTTAPVASVAPDVDPDDRRTPLGVVGRVTRILNAFSESPDRLMLEDVMALTGLPRSTAFRILGQLIDEGWVEHDTRGYRLGPHAPTLTGRPGEHQEVRVAASPYLNELHAVTGAVAHLSVLEGDRVHYLDKIGGSAARAVPSRVGARLLACDTVSGRALLACRSPEYVDEVLGPRLPPARLADLHRELAAVRQRRGVVHAPADPLTTGIASIAAPVLGPHGAVAAISLAVPGDLPPARIAPLLLGQAHRIAGVLHPQRRRHGRSWLR